MDRRTREHLAQTLQQMDQRGALSAHPRPATAQAAVLQGHLDVWERLAAVRPVNPAPQVMAAGRERMISALASAANPGRSNIFALLLVTPLALSAAIVLGLMLLTGAAAGASAPLGGPQIWHAVGISRSNDSAVDRSGTSNSGPGGPGNASEDNSGSGGSSGSDDSAQGSGDDGSGDDNSASGSASSGDDGSSHDAGDDSNNDGDGGADDGSPSGPKPSSTKPGSSRAEERR